MKLKNKKTGEVVTLTLSTNGEDLIIMGNDMLAHITKLSELKDYEDYEEPKESEYYWYIGYKNDIRRTKYHHISDFADNQVTETRKEIGNCFESLEDAERALEKLKAWKRLKDKGFRFTNWEFGDVLVGNLLIEAKLNFDNDSSIQRDLEICFGGEE